MIAKMMAPERTSDRAVSGRRVVVEVVVSNERRYSEIQVGGDEALAESTNF
jgi:hypothetical protein